MTKFEGTFQGHTTGPDASGLIQLAAIVAAAVVAVMILVEYAALIIVGAVILGVARGWFMYRRVLAIRDIQAAGERVRIEQQLRHVAALQEQRLHEIAVAEAQGRGQAQASAALVAPLVAAIAALNPPQYRPAPVPVIHAEVVER